jgi:hypothetical protein
MCALMAAPVLGLNSGQTAVTGNISAYAAISLNASSVLLGDSYGTMAPNADNKNQSLGVIVTANNGFSVTVKDFNNGQTGHTNAGFMYPYVVGTGYDTTNYPVNLTDALQVSPGTTLPSMVTGSTPTPPITDGSTLFQSGHYNAFNAVVIPTTINQHVEYYDPVLPATDTYRIDLEFDISTP